MLIKVVSLFLVVMVVLALFGRWRTGGAKRARGERVLPSRRCPSCAGYAVGPAACPCGQTRGQ
jgi:hypothetical protein